MDAGAGQIILVTGASGLVGRPLCSALERAGHRVMRAVRRPVIDPVREMHWDPSAGILDRQSLTGVDAVVHLAGENIAKRRWSSDFKTKIRDSRVHGTALLAQSLAQLDPPPSSFCCASAIGFYGDRGDAILDETSTCGADFLAQVCREWEEACQPARDAGVRVANMRIGVVLSAAGGALKQMLLPFKFGLGGVVGSGNQFMSWIALDDLVRAIAFVVGNANLSGPVNLTSPEPVTNRQFTKTLGNVLSRPTLLPLPGFAARAAFGEMADALLLASTRVDAAVLRACGFEFQWNALEPALRHILGKLTTNSFR